MSRARRIENTVASFEWHVSYASDGMPFASIIERCAGTSYLHEIVVPAHLVNAVVQARRQYIRHKVTAAGGVFIFNHQGGQQ